MDQKCGVKGQYDQVISQYNISIFLVSSTRFLVSLKFEKHKEKFKRVKNGVEGHNFPEL